jgi:probable F420-dependent oxidoreductase
MQIGIHVPQWGPDAARDGVLAVARAAEEAGLDSIWVADHVVYPLFGDTQYPYSSDGLPFTPDEGFLDALTTLAVVAGATQRVKLGTSVLVAPMREPLQLAKAVATLDVLSGGRVVLGLGVGWWKEEFDALGVDFSARGARVDEQIGVLRRLWADGRLEHHGRFYDFGEVACEPRPVQPGGPRLLVGGIHPASRRRAARLGDGWHAVGSNTESLAEGYAEVRQLAQEAGRDPDAILLSTSAGLPADPTDAVRRLTRLAQAGVGNVVLNLGSAGAAETCAAIEILATQVLPVVSQQAPLGAASV